MTDFPLFDWRLPLTDRERYEKLLDKRDEVLVERRPKDGWLKDRKVQRREK